MIDKEAAKDAIRALPGLRVTNTEYVPQLKRRPGQGIDRAAALLAIEHVPAASPAVPDGLDEAWAMVEASLPKGSPAWEALIRAATLVGRSHVAARLTLAGTQESGVRIGLDASLFPHRGSWRHGSWCSFERGDDTSCTCGLDYLRRSLNYEGDEPDARPTRNSGEEPR